MSTDYEALRKSHAHQPRILHLIAIAESAGVDLIEDQDVPAGVMVGGLDVEESIFGPCEVGTDHEQHDMCSVSYPIIHNGRKFRKVCGCQCHRKE